MSALANLREYGISTTKADYWIHLFPTALEVFWYRVEHCRTYLDLKNVPVTLGRSRDGTVTANGYLIPKTAHFVCRADVTPSDAVAFNWLDMTDRQFGFAGESLVASLIEKRVIHFPIARATLLQSAEEQYSSRDFSVAWFKPLSVEVKTDRHSKSANLYVQTHEGGHRFHQVRVDGDLVERVTSAPALNRGGAA